MIPLRQLIKDPATRPLAASPSRSRRRPAAARTSGRSPAGLRQALPDTSPQPGRHRVAPPGKAQRTRSSGTTTRGWTTGSSSDSNQPLAPVRRPTRGWPGMTYGELRYDEPEPGGPATTSRSTTSPGSRNCGAAPPRIPRRPVVRRVRAAAPSAGRNRQVPRSASRPAFRRRRTGHPVTASPAGTARARSPAEPAGPADERRAPPAGSGGSGRPGAGFLSAPVGLLTPPGGTRVDALRDGGTRPAAPAASPHRTPRRLRAA